MTQWFSNTEALVRFARLRALRGFYDGPVTPTNQHYVGLCSHVLTLSPEMEATILFTRDTGHHSGGWWKNPDYERCWHLSLAYRNSRARQFLPHDRDRSEEIARLFFDDCARLCWIEGPYSADGKAADVWHYRLFCDPSWSPILPRGEVYSREHTPTEWQSFSEIHGFKPSIDQAPYLLAASQ